MSSAFASPLQASKPVGARSSTIHGCSRSGFTLVELLVVIAIITVLAGMTVGGALVARVYVKNAAINMELKQLEMACQAYKEKFGEYPPDGTNAAAVARHLRKAFPRCSESAYPKWVCEVDRSDPNNPVYTTALNPATALGFWLGGVSDGNGRLIGFSADPTNPFSPSAASRIGPFFDFDPLRQKGGVVSDTDTTPYQYWPQGAEGEKTTGPIVYFRAENGHYDNAKQAVTANNIDPSAKYKVFCPYPAVDTRLSNVPTTYVWVNPKSFQIFSSGLDVQYAMLKGGTVYSNCLAFPTGENYYMEVATDPHPGASSFDDITNFSGGKLESAIP